MYGAQNELCEVKLTSRASQHAKRNVFTKAHFLVTKLYLVMLFDNAGSVLEYSYFSRRTNGVTFNVQ